MTARYSSAAGIATEGEPNERLPRDTRPLATPAYWKGSTTSSKRATYQRKGREKATPEAFQRIARGNVSAPTTPGSRSASTSAAGRPTSTLTATT